jgi:hypothetical protein
MPNVPELIPISIGPSTEASATSEALMPKAPPWRSGETLLLMSVKTEQIEKACRVGAARAFVRDRCTNVSNPFGGGKRVTAFGRVLVSGR